MPVSSFRAHKHLRPEAKANPLNAFSFTIDPPTWSHHSYTFDMKVSILPICNSKNWIPVDPRDLLYRELSNLLYIHHRAIFLRALGPLYSIKQSWNIGWEKWLRCWYWSADDANIQLDSAGYPYWVGSPYLVVGLRHLVSEVGTNNSGGTWDKSTAEE